MVALERLFRQYHRFCLTPSEDSLFILLNCLHSANDHLRKEHNRNFYAFQEYAGLIALRNLAHHEADAQEAFQVHPAASLPTVHLELGVVCLVPRNVVEQAVAGVGEKWREDTVRSCDASFNIWGEVVDIYPAIFNVMVRIFELCSELKPDMRSSQYGDFQATYERESRDRIDHHCRGAVSCLAGDVSQVLTDIAKSHASRRRGVD